jgi:hypothetical protein
MNFICKNDDLSKGLKQFKKISTTNNNTRYMFSQINLFEDDDAKTSKRRDDSAKAGDINKIYKNTATNAVASGSNTIRHNKTQSLAVLS